MPADRIPPKKGDRVKIITTTPSPGYGEGKVIAVSALTAMVQVEHDNGDVRWWTTGDVRPA